jgi:hypothetical protein
MKLQFIHFYAILFCFGAVANAGGVKGACKISLDGSELQNKIYLGDCEGQPCLNPPITLKVTNKQDAERNFRILNFYSHNTQHLELSINDCDNNYYMPEKYNVCSTMAVSKSRLHVGDAVLLSIGGERSQDRELKVTCQLDTL